MMFGLLFTHENVCMKITFLEFEENIAELDKKIEQLTEYSKKEVYNHGKER